MRKIIVSEFLTLDGVMQAPGLPDEDTEGGFTHGGWQRDYFDDVFADAVMGGFSTTDALLLGRRTYDIFASYWPHQPEGDPVAPTMNGFDKYVVSRTLDKAEWVNSTVVKGDVVAELTKIKEGPGKDIRVIGSGELTQTLIASDLVDQYDVMIHPLFLGTGKRLFREGLPATRLKLTDSNESSKGVVILSYAPEGAG